MQPAYISVEFAFVPSRLFLKIFATYAVLSLISAAVLIAILSGRQREIIVAQVEQRLRDSALLLQHDIADNFPTSASAKQQAALERLGQQTETRMTLIAADGTVLADSDADPVAMENHRNRAELKQARTDGFGMSQRTSPTQKIRMMYYALRVGERDTPAGFVRVATPMNVVDAQVASVEWLVLVTSIAVSLVALGLTYIVLGRIIRPLQTLTLAAKSIADGDVQQQVDVRSRDEFGALAESFNRMSRQLSSRINELSRTSAQFAENSERLEAVLEGMIEGVVAVDNNERILFANRAANALLEFATPNYVGQPIWETIRNPTIQEVVREALETKEQKRVELKLPRTQAIVELSATSLPGEPCPGVILVLYDVTELRRLENVRQQFVSNVSHELKTPLASIQAYTETLLGGAIDDPAHNREFLARIEEQAERLHSLILDLLRLARIESGEAPFALATVSLGDAVEACVEQHAGIAELKQLTLTTAPWPTAISVRANEEGLRTILDNLVENAINYTPAGGRVEIRWRAEDAMAVVEVADTGVGLAKKHRTRIFERFYRVDKARSREVGGTGLGLSIVKHLVLEFGGGIEVESTLGKGSTFTVRLPLA